jgi:hypothetical protein
MGMIWPSRVINPPYRLSQHVVGRDPAIYVLIKHFLLPLLLPGFTLLEQNYLEIFQIPAISECNKSIIIKTGQKVAVKCSFAHQ